MKGGGGDGEDPAGADPGDDDAGESRPQEAGGVEGGGVEEFDLDGEDRTIVITYGCRGMVFYTDFHTKQTQSVVMVCNHSELLFKHYNVGRSPTAALRGRHGRARMKKVK